MKSNIYSIIIFLVALFATYTVTKNFQTAELMGQREEIAIQSQSITNTIKKEIFAHALQLSETAQHWHSIDEINHHWEADKKQLHARFPHLSHLTIYLAEEIPEIGIDKKHLHYFPTKKEAIELTRRVFPIDKKPTKLPKDNFYISAHEQLKGGKVAIYLQAPIFIAEQFIGYLDATLNITDLLNEQVENALLTHPFSISDTGRTIYSRLPQHVQINNIDQNFTITLLNHKWKLMVWPLHEHRAYQYIPFIGLIFSVLLSLLTYLAMNNKDAQRKLLTQKSYIKRVNKDFKASKSKLKQSNKLSSLGEIATGLAHEINQPLQVICIHADIYQENLQKENYRLVEKSFHSILSQVERIEKIVKQVGSFGRDSELDKYTHQLPVSIFENVLNIVINQYNQEGVELRQVLPPSLPSVFCNKTQIEQVLVNLLINAKDAVEDSDEKIVFIKAHDKQGKLYIEVSDSGSGIDPSKLDDIFTPFYTTKALGKGTGLGLSISYSIIHQHKGEFQVSSEIGKGSTFTIILPLD